MELILVLPLLPTPLKWVSRPCSKLKRACNVLKLWNAGFLAMIFMKRLRFPTVCDKNSWDTSTQCCFFTSGPSSYPPNVGYCISLYQILHTNIGRAGRLQSVPTVLTEAVVAQEQKRGTRGYWALLELSTPCSMWIMIFACPRALMSALSNG